MTPERWRQIETLYHSAREHGRGVLAETDPELRRQVEQLLDQDSGGKILDLPAACLMGDSTATHMPASPGPDRSGTEISHYRILEKLGAGGMGVVYKAFDTKLGRLAALKFLPPHMRHEAELNERLAREARAASALDHPNIVVVYDIDQTQEGDLFVAMAYHEGATLRQRMAAGLPLLEGLRIARQIAAGLARAHENGIIHRDIKPANVIVDKDGVARIIDFGLARVSDATVTDEGAVKGTPLYMSPEQARGAKLDCRTDLWSLGAALYEMAAGRPPFRGDTQLSVMRAIVDDTAPRLRTVRADVPPEVEAVVERAMQKDLEKRYQSAAEMGRDLAAAIAAMETPRESQSRAVKTYWVAAAAVMLAMAGGGMWLYRRSEDRHWVREKAIPAIRGMEPSEGVAIYNLLAKAEKILPDDPDLLAMDKTLTTVAPIESNPPGAKVEIQDYDTPNGPWLTLGTTPLRVRMPKGYFRWRVSKPGVGDRIVASPIDGERLRFDLQPAGAMPGMVRVPGGSTGEMVGFLGWLHTTLPPFDIDQHEVTNAEYQKFVDAGGYRNRDYWKEPIAGEGRPLTWEQAMARFVDITGRPGPLAWESGHYPVGKGDYPVTGVSFYEAAAYAEFAGKSLPVLLQWFSASPSDLVGYAARLANGTGSMQKVGASGSVGPYGTYDMVGNAYEWCRSAVDGDKRFVLLGYALSDSNHKYAPEALPPMARSDEVGLRCVRNLEPLPDAATAPLHRITRDFGKVATASDTEFQSFQVMYKYDAAKPVDAQGITALPATPDWTEEKLTIDAGYDGVRLPVYVFLPKRVRPPFQTVVFFASARVNGRELTDNLGDLQFADYVIQSGRALVYPIAIPLYRRGRPGVSGPIGELDRLIKGAKEVRRTVDYLETRPDLDHEKIAYMGVSQGGAWGPIFMTLEQRFKTGVFLDGGYFLGTPLPAADPAAFAGRLRAPVLMVNGIYDPTFPPDLSQNPMFEKLGTPAADKRHVVFATPHDTSVQKGDLAREVRTWLDKHLGTVNLQ